LSCLHCCKAFAAVNRSVAVGLEGNLGGLSTVSAHSFKHLSGCFTCILASIAASLASLRLILETLFSVEFLFACSEDKIFATIFAFQCDVLVHTFSPRLKKRNENFTLGRTQTATFAKTTLLLSYTGIYKSKGIPKTDEKYSRSPSLLRFSLIILTADFLFDSIQSIVNRFDTDL